MPPTFAYIMALMLYGMLALPVWIVSLILAMVPRWRSLGGKLALAMLMTFPGVFIYQVAAFPVIVLTFLVINHPFRVLEPIHTKDAIAISLVFLILLGGFTAASIAGFVDGWKFGWSVAGSTDIATALKLSTASRIVRTLIRRIRKSEMPGKQT